MRYADDESLFDARRRYFDDNDFGADGGYEAKWVKVQFGPLPLAFPNSDGRRRAVRYHDLHHVLTDYDTDWIGEAEIGAWEVASSCRDQFAAWLLNLSVMFLGAIVAPRRTFRAFVRGRHSGNLYAHPWEAIPLDDAVGRWREELGLTVDVPSGTFRDRLAYLSWLGPAFAAWALMSAFFIAPIVVLVWAFSQLF